MDELTLEVQERKETGTGPNRRLRKTGLLPAVVYGGGKDPISIQVDQKSIHRLLREVGGENAVFRLKLGGTDQSRHTMVRKIDERTEYGLDCVGGSALANSQSERSKPLPYRRYVLAENIEMVFEDVFDDNQVDCLVSVHDDVSESSHLFKG